MKKLKLLFSLTVFSLVLFTGCSSDKMVASSMLRTVGVGENALPIEGGSFALESFYGNATNVDVINKITYQYWVNYDTDDLLLSTQLKNKSKIIGFNGRIGFDDYTEVKIGTFVGATEYSYNIFLTIDGEQDVHHDEASLNSTFSGVQIGVKRLLTDYDNPLRLSLYLEGREIYFTNSHNSMSSYNGSNTEFKSALIVGYLDDPTRRNFPSLSLFYSLANTSRKATIPDVPAKKHPQALGLEANFNMDMGAIYANLSTGIEKELFDKATDDIIVYTDFRVGFHFMRKK